MSAALPRWNFDILEKYSPRKQKEFSAGNEIKNPDEALMTKTWKMTITK